MISGLHAEPWKFMFITLIHCLSEILRLYVVFPVKKNDLTNPIVISRKLKNQVNNIPTLGVWTLIHTVPSRRRFITSRQRYVNCAMNSHYLSRHRPSRLIRSRALSSDPNLSMFYDI